MAAAVFAAKAVCVPVIWLCVCLQVVLPATVPASLMYLRADGAYLLDTGVVLLLWLGRDVQPAWLTQVRDAARG